MYIRNSILVAICTAVILSTSAAAKDIAIYRWVDENNVVHFSQHEPQDENYSQLITFASYKANQPSDNTELPSADNKTLTVSEKLAQTEKRRADILEKNKKIAEKNCNAARVNIKMLNSFSKISVSDDDGKNHVLTDKERKEQLTLSNKHVDLYCNNASNKQS